MEEAEKNILRTHTTANSARMLYQLAQQVITIQSECYSSRMYLNRFINILLAGSTGKITIHFYMLDQQEQL